MGHLSKRLLARTHCGIGAGGVGYEGRFQGSRALLWIGCVGNLAQANSMTGCLNESYLEIQRNKVGLKL